MKYSIYHPVKTVKNRLGKLEICYELIVTLIADSLEDAWRKTQRGYNRGYDKLNKPSTDVGHVIKGPNSFNVVMQKGFATIDKIKIIE